MTYALQQRRLWGSWQNGFGFWDLTLFMSRLFRALASMMTVEKAVYCLPAQRGFGMKTRHKSFSLLNQTIRLISFGKLLVP
jgi:hypothetical protein